MKKIILLIVALVFIATPAFATDYYMANDPCSGNTDWASGSNSNNGLTKGTPFLTLQHAMGEMSANDTLIIDDGTYTGADNQITTTEIPPSGTGGNFTTIKADNDGKAIFDGENARDMFYVSTNTDDFYWSFEGLIWCRGTGNTVTLVSGESHGDLPSMYVKFLRCGAYDTGAGNTVNWYIARTSYILMEDCYGYGTGRYKFLTYIAENIILRRCVARPDAIDTTGSPNPSSGITIYSSYYVEVQNCIVIDGDQTAYWITNAVTGSFQTPTTTTASNYVAYRGCIALNNKMGGFYSAQNNDNENLTVDDAVVWDCDISGNAERAAGVDNLILNLRATTNSYFKNMTVGESDGDFSWAVGPLPEVKNNIFYNIDNSEGNFWAWVNITDDNYNLYYGNTNNTGRTGANDITTTDPTTNCLDYITRIESGSDCDGTGESGADIGANIIYKWGTDGTFYGDSGYATLSESSLWPFPNEALIKTAMAAYTWDDGSGGDPEITGARGFCDTGETLTNYIWDYLGNGGYPGTPIVITGTMVAGGVTEAEMVTGGETYILTVTNDEFVETLCADNEITTAFLAGLDHDIDEAGGFDAQITLTYEMCVRDSATQVTVTTPAAAGYDITQTETGTWTVPASALVGSGDPVVATPTIPIAWVPVAEDETWGNMGCGVSGGGWN